MYQPKCSETPIYTVEFKWTINITVNRHELVSSQDPIQLSATRSITILQEIKSSLEA